MNARDLISSSLRKIGVIASGETPSAGEIQDGLSALNMMIGLWSTQNLLLFQLKREVFPLVANKADYTVGVGGDFDTLKPMEIVGAQYGELITTPVYVTPEPTEEDPDPDPVLTGYTYSSNFEIPMEVLPYQKWMGISLKETSSSIPTQVYVHGDSPLEKLSFWPMPSEECGFVMYSRKQLVDIADLDAELGFPPGYDAAIIYNLALELCPEYGREPSGVIVRNADKYLGKIKIKNSPVTISKSDVSTGFYNAGRKLSNILSGGG